MNQFRGQFEKQIQLSLITHVNGIGKADPNLCQMRESILFHGLATQGKENKAVLQLYVVLTSSW